MVSESGDYKDYSANPKIEYEINDETSLDRMQMSAEAIWTKEELKKLSLTYKKYKNRLQTFSNRKKFWTLISEELESDGFSKDASECEKQWNKLQRNKPNETWYISGGSDHDDGVDKSTVDVSEKNYQFNNNNRGRFMLVS